MRECNKTVNLYFRGTSRRRFGCLTVNINPVTYSLDSRGKTERPGENVAATFTAVGPPPACFHSLSRLC